MRYCRLFLFLPILLVWHQLAAAVDLVDLTIDSIGGAGWRASELELRIHLNQDNSLALDLRSSSLVLAVGEQRIRDIHWHCPRLERAGAEYACKQSRLLIGESPWGEVRLLLDWRFGDLDNWLVSLHQARIEAGLLEARLSMRQGKWQGKISSKQLLLEKILQLLPTAVSTGWSLSGKAALQAEFRGIQAELQQISLQLRAQQVAYADADGLQAGENLGLNMDLAAEFANSQWAGTLGISVYQGQMYSDPVYLAVGESPLNLNTRFKGEPRQGRLSLDGARLRLPGVVNANVTAGLEQGQLTGLEMELEVPELAGFYLVLAQPFLIGTVMDELSVRGSGQVYLKWRKGELTALDLDLQQANIEDEQGRFGVRELNTELNWLHQGEAAPSSLSVAGGHVFRIGFNQVEAKLLATNGQLLVRDKVTIPMLGGRLSLNNLVMDGLTRLPVSWQLAMTAEQIQLDALSRALDWPLLSGSLDGHIPNVRYADGNVLLDGELIVDVFGGRVAVQDLKIVDPMSVAPVLETQLRLRNLDLAQLTSTFSFGRIEGLLEGEVDELQLVGWELNRFRAGIRTPGHDKSRRRISQRAINNLTSLGTGMSAGLSGTALRTFKDFAYDRIALEVDLTGDTATLDGIAHKDGGYYIVKGEGLPRIDVIGHTREIAWKDLVSRIQEARFDDMVIE